MDERTTNEDKRYHILRGPGLFSSSRSYLGDDHLLSVNQFFCSEYYRRFFFKDIQAIVVRPTHWGYFTMSMSALMALLFLVLSLFSIQSDSTPYQAFVLIMLIYFLVMAVRCILRGPTCHVIIRTALQTERVRSFQYLKSTEFSLVILVERIEGLQGTLAREELEFSEEIVSEPAASSLEEEGQDSVLETMYEPLVDDESKSQKPMEPAE